jgi:hypothetical protein
MTLTLMRESWILIGICLADLLVTLGLLADPSVREGNPLMSYYLNHGTGAFVGVKLLLVVMPLFIAEYSKQFQPAFVRSMLRLAITAYVVSYVLLFAGLNLRPLAERIANSNDGRTSVATVTAR